MRTEDVVVPGTDAAERWPGAGIRAFAMPRFRPGTGARAAREVPSFPIPNAHAREPLARVAGAGPCR